MGHTMTLKGRRVCRGPDNLCEGIKIGSSISKFNNYGKIDKDIQTGVINVISSTSADQILFITFENLTQRWKNRYIVRPGKEKSIYFSSQGVKISIHIV